MKKFLNRKNIFVAIVIILSGIFLYFLSKESLERTLFLSLTLFIWLSIFLYTKELPLSSLLYILIVLPFNVTMQLPNVVEIFNTQIIFPEPFVNGMYVNYLVPTLSILDIGVVLFLLSLLVEKGISLNIKNSKSLKIGIVIFLIYLLIQNFLLKNPLVAFNSIRLFSYLLAIVSAINYFKERKHKLKKFLLASTAIFLLNVLIQGTIGILQVLKGVSLGLVFLGESQVVSGMQGSSFVALGGQLFLRAYGTFPHPNILGGFLILSILMGVLCARKIPGVAVSLVILSLCLLPFTFSRISFLIAILILLIVFLKSISKAKEKIFSLTPILFLERAFNLLRGSDGSWTERIDLFKASLEVIKENFFLGTGVGNFVKAMENWTPRTSRQILLLQPVHNIFLLAFAELGFFGFLAFFYILVKVFIENFKRFTYFKTAVLMSIVIIGFWDHYLFSLPQGLAIFMFLYILLVVDLDSLQKDKKDVKKN